MRPDMSDHQPDKLDRILAQEDVLLPSSGFTASVMDAIREEAAAPAPIPFPWKLALPGIAGFIAALILVVRFGLQIWPTIGQTELLPLNRGGFDLPPFATTVVLPALLAVTASLLCLLLTWRFAVGRSTR
jgi:hypothetical protein